MKVCFPVKEAAGHESEVYGHFGSASAFIVVETDTDEIMTIANDDRHHEHGKCSPVKAMGWHEVDCVVAGGIGAGALMKLGTHGIAVFRAGAGTVKENIELFKAGKLEKFEAAHVCGGHGHGGGCAH